MKEILRKGRFVDIRATKNVNISVFNHPTTEHLALARRLLAFCLTEVESKGSFGSGAFGSELHIKLLLSIPAFQFSIISKHEDL